MLNGIIVGVLLIVGILIVLKTRKNQLDNDFNSDPQNDVLED